MSVDNSPLAILLCIIIFRCEITGYWTALSFGDTS